MSVLTLCRDGSTVVGEHITSVLAVVFGDIKRPQTTPPAIAKVRRDKIVRIRQQLTHGTYDLDERLDAILERILSDIAP